MKLTGFDGVRKIECWSSQFTLALQRQVSVVPGRSGPRAKRGGNPSPPLEGVRRPFVQTPHLFLPSNYEAIGTQVSGKAWISTSNIFEHVLELLERPILLQ